MDTETELTKRKPKDRDFIETPEGFLFCVVGYLHPPGKYTAYLKYSPAPAGRWQRQGRAYRRELAFYHAHQVDETLEYLKVYYPDYFHYCPVRDFYFSMVPQNRVQTYYYPEQRYAIMATHDSLEEETVRVGRLFRKLWASWLKWDYRFDLVSIHSPSFLDIDLLSLGENTGKLRESCPEWASQAYLAGRRSYR
jgi:predicted nucleotidyltransferase